MPFLIVLQTAVKYLWLLFTVILEPVPAGQRARDYLNLYVNPTLLAGLTALCKEKPADPMVRTVHQHRVACFVICFLCVRVRGLCRKTPPLLKSCAPLVSYLLMR